MAHTVLGEVEITSGTLVLVDFGCLGMFGASPDAIRESFAAALAPGGSQAQHQGLHFVVVRGVPTGRHRVVSDTIDDGEDAGLRRSVTIELAEGAVAKAVELGTLLVDTARLGLFDLDALPEWNDSIPVDGLADVAFWGGDEDAVAARFEAPRTAEGVHGFVDRPYEEALELARSLHALRESGELRFAFDFRPHTHPYYLLAQLRASTNEAGVIEVGGRAACGFTTTWGDGWFPVELDVDADERPVRVRVVFETDEAIENLATVNP